MNPLESGLRMLSVQLVRVNGDSMLPALRHGQWVWVDRRAFRNALPQRFDVVRFEDPSRPGRWAIKRVVGLPGEHVVLERGRLIIDSRALDEPHLPRPHEDWEYHEWQLKEREYAVLGDNRAASTDSRRYGPVRRAVILGRVLLRTR